MRYLMKRESVFYLQKDAWDDVKDYKDSFKNVIKQRESSRVPFIHQSPQFAYRHHLVEHIKKMCIQKRLTHCCLHLAIYLLDIFMDNHSIAPERILLVANVCLLLAAKFEENTNNIPKIAELNSGINNRYPIKDYKELEKVIISKDDLNSSTQLRTLFYDLHDHMTSYLDHIITNIHYMQCYPPSALAAAVIAASRAEAGLNSWTDQLANFTDYKLEDFQELLTVLMNKKSKMHCVKCDPSCLTA